MIAVEMVDAELGVVRVCRICGEPWPRDREFFHIDRRGYVRAICRACQAEQRQQRRRRRRR